MNHKSLSVKEVAQTYDDDDATLVFVDDLAFCVFASSQIYLNAM